MSSRHLVIHLGPRWSQFAQERADMELLGTVQRGAQIGALARLPDGSYAQVNGDWVQRLHTTQVEFAMRRARRADREETRSKVNHRPPPPTVVVRKKRLAIAPPKA